ncbi:MAG: acireductone synthase [Methylococcales bacterium]|nr:acireductone synthase [Methylococcales bacterium]
MIDAIITDIEGTTSSLSFVRDTLFPYARTHLPDFVKQHAEQADVKALLDSAATLCIPPVEGLDELIAVMLEWIDQDQKYTPLKALQGLIWADGYQRGAFQGHIYPDACIALKQWHDQGIRLYVYSSGSVAAQKLLFGHTLQGDMTGLFTGFFDTRVGAKKAVESYQTLVQTLALPAERILFLSDSEAELDAAHAAGLQTIALARPGEGHGSKRHRSVSSFSAISKLI